MPKILTNYIAIPKSYRIAPQMKKTLSNENELEHNIHTEAWGSNTNQWHKIKKMEISAEGQPKLNKTFQNQS